jgi:hypothetical protein
VCESAVSQEGVSLDDGDSQSVFTGSSVDTNREIFDQETEQREGSFLLLESSPVSRNEPAERGEVLVTGDATMMRTSRSFTRDCCRKNIVTASSNSIGMSSLEKATSAGDSEFRQPWADDRTTQLPVMFSD